MIVACYFGESLFLKNRISWRFFCGRQFTFVRLYVNISLRDFGPPKVSAGRRRMTIDRDFNELTNHKRMIGVLNKKTLRHMFIFTRAV